MHQLNDLYTSEAAVPVLIADHMQECSGQVRVLTRTQEYASHLFHSPTTTDDVPNGTHKIVHMLFAAT